MLKLLNNTEYNDLIFAQEEMICFQIFEEEKKTNKYGDTRKAWMKLSRIFDPTIGALKTITCKKLSKYEVYYVTRYHEEWTTKL